jgi:predicted aspartyl protease
MATWTGSFDNAGSPRVKISLYGYSQQLSKEFDAIVDTGFTGFLSMPMMEAFPLGLILAGTTTTILADGSQSYKLTALGTVYVGDEAKVGVILLNLGAGPSDVLVGMDFLRTFKKTLFVHNQVVTLLDTDLVNQAVSEAMQRAASATAPTAKP